MNHAEFLSPFSTKLLNRQVDDLTKTIIRIVTSKKTKPQAVGDFGAFDGRTRIAIPTSLINDIRKETEGISELSGEEARGLALTLIERSTSSAPKSGSKPDHSFSPQFTPGGVNPNPAPPRGGITPSVFSPNPKAPRGGITPRQIMPEGPEFVDSGPEFVDSVVEPPVDEATRTHRLGRPIHVTMFFDFACPWCYVSAVALKAAMKRWGPVTLSYQPFLSDVSTATGQWDASTDTMLAHALVVFVEDDCLRRGLDPLKQTNKLVDMLFEAIYHRGESVNTVEAVLVIAERFGDLNLQEAHRFLSSQAAVDEVLRRDHIAKQQRVMGVPLFVLDTEGMLPLVLKGSQSEDSFMMAFEDVLTVQEEVPEEVIDPNWHVDNVKEDFVDVEWEDANAPSSRQHARQVEVITDDEVVDVSAQQEPAAADPQREYESNERDGVFRRSPGEAARDPFRSPGERAETHERAPSPRREYGRTPSPRREYRERRSSPVSSPRREYGRTPSPQREYGQLSKDELTQRIATPILVTTFFDFACPWCYVASVALKTAMKNWGPSVTLCHRPFLSDTGTATGKWQKWPNTILAHALVVFVGEDSLRCGLDPLVQTSRCVDLLFDAIYVQGENVSAMEGVMVVAERFGGLDLQAVHRFLHSQQAVDEVLRRDHIAKKERVLGTPLFVVETEGAEPIVLKGSQSEDTFMMAFEDSLGLSSREHRKD
jgi:predicted DsbA family dithiol-disulfide isomerase